MSLKIYLSAEVKYLADQVEQKQKELELQIKKEFPVGATFEFEFTRGWIRGVVQYAGLDHTGSLVVGFVNSKTQKERTFYPRYNDSLLIEGGSEA